MPIACRPRALDQAQRKRQQEQLHLERRCCPFVQFGLEWRIDETVWVRLTGGPGVKEALKAEIVPPRCRIGRSPGHCIPRRDGLTLRSEGLVEKGDLVTVGGGEGGRVTTVAGNNVEVELTDRPGCRFWYKAQDVRAGTPPPKPTMMAERYSQRKQAVEVRPVCKHLNLTEACQECRAKPATGLKTSQELHALLHSVGLSRRR